MNAAVTVSIMYMTLVVSRLITSIKSWATLLTFNFEVFQEIKGCRPLHQALQGVLHKDCKIDPSMERVA